MGVEYEHYLIPRDNTYRPSPAALSRLTGALLGAGFVMQPGSEVFRKSFADTSSLDDPASATGCILDLGQRRYESFPCPCLPDDVASLGEGRDFRLLWPVDSLETSGLNYPLAHVPTAFDASYELEIHVAGNYLHHGSEVIGPLNDLGCTCGQELSYEEPFVRGEDGSWEPPVFIDLRIRQTCPACGALFRPQDQVARIRDGRTGEVTEQRGGCCYRFAVVIDCGQAFDRETWPIRASSSFLNAVEQSLRQKFYELGDFS